MPVEVSVIIPTLNRPHLIGRAVRSVFAQTMGDFEVIVVIDGPDAATQAVLAAEPDPRLTVICNPKSLTAAGARNAGVAASAGAWVAFLDDDDEWLPEKLEHQLAVARLNPDALVSCRSRVVTPAASYVWPRVPYDGQAPVDEYLFVRRGVFSGSAFIQTSSFLLPRRLALAWPFDTSTPHDDWDFLLRLCKRGGARIIALPDILATLYAEETRPSLSGIASWPASLDWLERNRALFTRRGYAGFCLGVVGARAANEGAGAAVFFNLLGRAFSFGAPRTLQLLAYCAFWTVSQNLRRRLRGVLSGGRIGRHGGGGRLVAPDDAARHA
jgi:glycosyltransferase involved in cell wall biosynthesis